jgi:hypothetical protein
VLITVIQGAYFDSTLHALARWPIASLPTISVVQDPLDPTIASKQNFAQPIVFFRLDAFTTLVRSPLARKLTSLRLRIPSRQVARFLCGLPGSLPAVELLDLSTCNILDGEVEPLIARFGRLRHLILDGCSVLRGGEFRESEWAELGRACALGGVFRAREREKKLKGWLEANAALFAVPVTPAANAGQMGGNGTRIGEGRRRGRRGIATSTITLRDPSPNRNSASRLAPKVVIPKIRVLPSYPTLRTFTTTAPAYIDEDLYPAIKHEFSRGWEEGLRQIRAIRIRLRTSWNNGMRVMRIFDLDDMDQSLLNGSMEEDGMDGLVDLMAEDSVWLVDDRLFESPVFCLAGPGKKADHAIGCGHRLGWEAWDDDM